MAVTEELASISILLSHHDGTEIVNRIIPFKVFEHEEYYKAVPMIGIDERSAAGLSAELSFSLINDRIVLQGDVTEVSRNAIVAIAGELRILRLV